MPRAAAAATIAAMAAEQRRLCTLRAAVGREEDCPEDACPFWEPGGAVLGGRCAIGHLDLARDVELSSWLLALRARLAAGGSSDVND
jgi:hypothetical protein